VRGSYTTVSSVEVDSLSDAPEDVTNFNVEVSGNTLILSWEPVSDLDLSHYKIRHSIEETSATWGGSTLAVPKVARPSDSVSLPLRSGTYHIRAYDKNGTPSENYTSVVVPSTYLPSYTTTTTQTEDATFGGTMSGVSKE